MKKPSKKTAISALLIGILGTAIWEKILSPLCTFIYIKLSSLIDSFSVTFSNHTYIEIAKGYNDSIIVDFLYYLCIFFMALFIIAFQYIYFFKRQKMMLSIRERYSTIEKKNEIQKTSMELKQNYIFSMCIILSFLLLMTFFMYWIGNLTFINNCKSSSLCNLEIISPYVSDTEYKHLRSNFYSIQTKEDYESFTNTIKEIGEKYSLNLK